MTAIINASTSSGLITTADTSGTLALQSNGTTQFTVSSTGSYGQLKSGTAVASTSGTSIDFTSIPSWVKRITVMFTGVSTNGTSNLQIQIGAGSVTTSGYNSYSMLFGGSGGTGAAYTSGFGIKVASAAFTVSGQMIISLLGSNTWTETGGFGNSGTGDGAFCSGGIALGGALDRVRITTVNGTDAFDAGSINIMYEG